MEGVGAALCHDFDFGARRTVEVSGLIRGVDLELFHAICGSGHHAGRFVVTRVLSGNATGRIADCVGGDTGSVHAAGAVHIIGIVAAVQREVVLVDNGSRNAAVRPYARLQFDEGVDVATDTRQVVDRFGSNRVSHGGVHGL